jgi:hypothetical protein
MTSVRAADLARPGPDGPEPTPWGTGVTVSVMVGLVAMAIVLLVSAALRGAYGWWWIPANLLLGVGLAPSLWLLRKMLFWRWIAYGVAGGFVVAWVALAVSTLFRARTGAP